jgi:hypothetical protein
MTCRVSSPRLDLLPGCADFNLACTKRWGQRIWTVGIRKLSSSIDPRWMMKHLQLQLLNEIWDYISYTYIKYNIYICHIYIYIIYIYISYIYIIAHQQFLWGDATPADENIKQILQHGNNVLRVRMKVLQEWNPSLQFHPAQGCIGEK